MKTATEVRACTACAGALPHARWEALPLVETIEPDAILRCVSVWREADRIEVRSCIACGRAIARTVKCRQKAESSKRSAASGKGEASD